MLSKSIEERAISLMIQGVDEIEAINIALIEENKLITEMLEQRTERSIKAKNHICKNVYGLIHLINYPSNPLRFLFFSSLIILFVIITCLLASINLGNFLISFGVKSL